MVTKRAPNLAEAVHEALLRGETTSRPSRYPATTAPAPASVKEEPWAGGIRVTHAETDPPHIPAVRIGERFLVPGRMVALIEHPALPVTVEVAIEIGHDHAVHCSRLTCTDRSVPRGVTGEKLRRLPVERIIRSVLAAAAEDELGRSLDWVPGHQDAFSEALAIGNPASRWALTEDHLAEVARVYREAVASRERTPVNAVATHFGRPRPTAARWVQKARQAGLLGETTQGRVSELGDKEQE